MPRLLVAHTELCKTKITCRHIEGRGKRGRTVEEQSLEDGQGKHCTGFPAWSWQWCLRWSWRWWGWCWWWWWWRWWQSTCLLVQSVPASAPLSGLPPPPSPCSPASTCYWTILSMIGYHGFALTGSRLTRWKPMHFMDPTLFHFKVACSTFIWLGLVWFCFAFPSLATQALLTSPQANMTRNMETSIMSSSKNLLITPCPCCGLLTAAATGLSAIFSHFIWNNIALSTCKYKRHTSEVNWSISPL